MLLSCHIQLLELAHSERANLDVMLLTIRPFTRKAALLLESLPDAWLSKIAAGDGVGSQGRVGPRR
jgi:hypothetical protein